MRRALRKQRSRSSKSKKQDNRNKLSDYCTADQSKSREISNTRKEYQHHEDGEVKIDYDSRVSEVEGRAIQLRAEIHSILKENPNLLHNSANVKEKLRLRLEGANKTCVFEKEKHRINNVIRS